MPFLAKVQRLSRDAIAMRLPVGLRRTHAFRPRRRVSAQFIAQPADPCGGYRAMDRLQGCAQPSDCATDGKAARRADVPVMMRVEKRHVRLPVLARCAPHD
jgi:hypothetical protein